MRIVRLPASSTCVMFELMCGIYGDSRRSFPRQAQDALILSYRVDVVGLSPSLIVSVFLSVLDDVCQGRNRLKLRSQNWVVIGKARGPRDDADSRVGVCVC